MQDSPSYSAFYHPLPLLNILLNSYLTSTQSYVNKTHTWSTNNCDEKSKFCMVYFEIKDHVIWHSNMSSVNQKGIMIFYDSVLCTKNIDLL